MDIITIREGGAAIVKVLNAEPHGCENPDALATIAGLAETGIDAAEGDASTTEQFEKLLFLYAKGSTPKAGGSGMEARTKRRRRHFP